MEDQQPPEIHLNGVVPPSITSTENPSTKRQRRPSVRLGDIGDQAYDNRRLKQCKPPIKDSGKGLRARPVVNLSGGSGAVAGVEYHETLEGVDKEGNLESVAIGSWKVRDSKSRRGGGSAKRIRSNWLLKTEEAGGGDEKISGGDEDMEDERFRDFNAEDSDSRLKEPSPINSLDNNNNNNNIAIDAADRGRRRVVVVRGSHEEGVDMDGGPSDNDGRNWNQEVEERNGVKVWLNQLGLGRYAPVFEIHEVDDEVLPLLTLEDLKDMGINAVGSRRKMFCAIQKLNRGFS
ncbi:ankyrin repeat and SAM domain-containing protein 6-like [Impatiens glandulifera]|uniref:ankyrin repeat and SAM domain-containing protein 6-like n=1 Tax=Impatiens glandulifera TaxID=253017 RepID=UPI001FB0CCDC|nr:ankyrin repeat and SAM domain-containing protein 6-like [Impatiens glandulifera]